VVRATHAVTGRSLVDIERALYVLDRLVMKVVGPDWTKTGRWSDYNLAARDILERKLDLKTLS
jgi:hypothetical protein